MPLTHFSQLNSWQEARTLVSLIYKVAKSIPGDERFGLISQIERAAVSIASNIAEGFSRKTTKEKLQFYSISLSSLMEVENQLIICKDLEYITQESYEKVYTQLVIVRKLLYGMNKYLSR